MKPSKKTYLLTTTILILALLTSLEFAFSQKVTQPKIPAAVTTAFAKQYPGIPVKWEKEDGQFEASFTKDATPMSITYEANGNIFETEAEIKVAALPESIKNYLKRITREVPFNRQHKSPKPMEAYYLRLMLEERTSFLIPMAI